MALLTGSASDTVSVADSVSASVAFEVRKSDSVAVTDSLLKAVTRGRAVSDSVALTDEPKMSLDYVRVMNDSIALTDSIADDSTSAFFISQVRALTPTRVRIDFEGPAIINAALTRPASYVFDNLSPGSVEVVPLSVSLPAGQVTPLYVEIETTEHTNTASYDVALTPGIRGAGTGTRIGSTEPVGYTGLGIAPTLQLVVAISPTEVQVHFSEGILNEADANNIRNYNWDGGLNTVAVRSVAGSVVTLQTTPQVPGLLYTLTVTAIPPGSGALIEDDPIEVEDDLLAELTTFDVHISDDIDVDTDSILAEVPPVQLGLVVGRYLAPDDISSGVQSSLDGITWTAEARSFFDGEGRGLFNAGYGLGLNLIIGGSVIYTSNGHGTWSPQYGMGDIQCVEFSPELGLFVVGGHNGFKISTDGLNWTDVAADVAPFDVYFWSVAWSPELGLFVAGDNSGDFFNTSPDGVTWTRHSQGGGFFGIWWSIVWNAGAGLFVATGGQSAGPDPLQTSPDGINWTVQTPGSGYSGQWLSCATNGSRFVITGYAEGTPEVQTSDDGITWTRRHFANFYLGFPYSVTYRADFGLFIMCGDGGEIQTSPDGITWTHRTPGGGITDALFRGVA